MAFHVGSAAERREIFAYLKQRYTRPMRRWLPIALLLPLAAAGEYAEIHGVKMYYEIHGEGRPIVLLHGGTSSLHISFAEQVPVFAKNHRVIGIEQMGHGHTGDVAGRELSYEGMAEDTAALLVHLGIQNADLVGWSDGGQIALRLAFTHPELVRRVVASGVGIGAETPQEQQAIRRLSADHWAPPVQAEYAQISPDGAQHWPIFFDKIKAMWAKPNWGISEPELQKIKSPVLIVAGDHDVTSVEETARIVRMIPGARLLVLPATNHFTFQKRANWLDPIVLDFLDGN